MVIDNLNVEQNYEFVVEWKFIGENAVKKFLPGWRWPMYIKMFFRSDLGNHCVFEQKWNLLYKYGIQRLRMEVVKSNNFKNKKFETYSS